MAHLTCLEHGKRVIYKETALIHRNGDGSKCTMMGSSLDILMLTNAAHVKLKRSANGAKLLRVSFETLGSALKNTTVVFNKFLQWGEEHPNPYLLTEDEVMVEAYSGLRHNTNEE